MHTKVSLIVPYFEDGDQLIRFLNMEGMSLWDEIIIVDDGSEIELAKDIVNEHNEHAPEDLNIRILRVPINYGFNGHGCRNLGVQQAKNDWVFLIDVDMIMEKESIEAVHQRIPEVKEDQFLGVYSNGIAPPTIPDWAKDGWGKNEPVEYNTYAIRKQTFLDTRGYDEDYRNMHGGSRVFIERLQTFLERVHFDDIVAGPMRHGREVRELDGQELTEYDDHFVYHPPTYYKFDKLLKEISYYRNEHPETWKDKTFVDFEWYEETL